MYTGDVRKHLASYRIPPDLLAEVTAKAAERGETVTEVVILGFQAYVRSDGTAGIALMAPVTGPAVHTVPEWPASYGEAPERPACKHPADRVDTDTSVCRDCGADVW